MKVKRLLFKMISLFGLLIIFISFVSAEHTTSYTVKFNGLGEYLKNKLIGLHFKGGGNDFGGMFFVTSIKDIDNPVTITLGGNEKVNCTKLARGYLVL